MEWIYWGWVIIQLSCFCDHTRICSPEEWRFPNPMRFDMWPSLHLLDSPTLRNQHFHRSNPPFSHMLYADSHSQQSLLGPFCSWQRFALMVSVFTPPSPSTYPAQMNSSPLTLTLIPSIPSKHVTYLLSSSTLHLVPLLTSTLTLIFDSC